MAISPSLDIQILTSEERWRRWEQRGLDRDAQFLRRAQRFLWLVLLVLAVGVLYMSVV